MIGLLLNLSLLFLHAEVVKLANTLRSGRSGRKLLRVQLPSSAKLGIFYKLLPRTNFFAFFAYAQKRKKVSARLAKNTKFTNNNLIDEVLATHCSLLVAQKRRI